MQGKQRIVPSSAFALLGILSAGFLIFRSMDLIAYAKEGSPDPASTTTTEAGTETGADTGTDKGTDTTPPTLNAAVSDGYLQITAQDTESRIDRLYVCGYEYSGFENGTLSIRLQQFDAGYENFSIFAVDMAGNISEEYLVPNPYYEAPDVSSKEMAEALPTDASATGTTSATGTVTEHTVTASRNDTGHTTAANGTVTGDPVNTTNSTTEYTANGSGTITERSTGASSAGSKEFYTIQTGNGKTFYLVIDRDQSTENVHFLTDISERDLLNATQDNNATLPRNSAVTASGFSRGLIDSALPNNNPVQLWQDNGKSNGVPESSSATGEGNSVDNGENPSGEVSGQDAPAVPLPAKGLIRFAVIAGGMLIVAVAIVLIRKKRKGDDAYEEEDEDEFEDEDAGEDDVKEGDEAEEEAGEAEAEAVEDD